MKKQKKIIIANWKMNPDDVEDARVLFRKTRNVANELWNTTTVICPPFVFLPDLGKLVSTKRCVLGAQNVFWENSPSAGGEAGEGAHTGEISPRMLSHMGIRFVILGHSERRALGESDAAIARKVRAAISSGLTVILCIGEPKRDGEGEYLHFIKEELKNSLAGTSRKHLGNLIIAYEPIWAVGPHAKEADTSDELFEMVILIRKIIGELFGRQNALAVPVLYGGSVNEKNAKEFLTEGGVHGLLVGRASLEPKIFSSILEIADKIKT